ncbi:DUF839 domain-containing protein [Hyunsoonleella sp. SJ7]|uniref:DUF839 domain-containing protein n=1 Tax=Hyunsoonleella aquatilis TaxID=2762758 RepID=A0A923HGG8_9FLAO|nr:alkaline phosphatase PhoX [Hyunsoonleella aquatilis]MBC3758925.1 DUF839 domain-containing protein [Hyunsoonleella aquatilis]
MKTTLQLFLVASFLGFSNLYGQVGSFTSVTPAAQTDQFIIPSTHTFQVLAESGDAITGGTLPNTPDFTAYVPIGGSSTNGYLSLNHEKVPGAVTIFDINFNGTTKLWEKTSAIPIDFSPVFATAANCSGTVTSWGNVISCEETSVATDFNFDGYNDVGWNVEINPATRSVVGSKLYAMGHFKHENVAIHSNGRTVYQGADDTSGFGFLYKFVATNVNDLSAGDLYVFSGSKSGTGSWVLINDSTNPAHQLASHQNNTNALSQSAGATEFRGIEDVEIGPDGMIYFAVKNAPDNRVYRFADSDPLETSASTVTMETFAGNMSYDINDGSSTTSVPWGVGNDNMAFDGDGNLWVLQDNDNHYIWVVKSGHTQASPDVEIFGITPSGAEPTGITFTPDYKYVFMSIQHPSGTNMAGQVDVAGNTYDFELGTTLVVALNSDLGTSLSIDEIGNTNEFKFYPNPINLSKKLHIEGNSIHSVELYTIQGKQVLNNSFNGLSKVELDLKTIAIGTYLLTVNQKEVAKLVVE